MFAEGIVTKFPLLEVKYQKLKFPQAYGSIHRP